MPIVSGGSGGGSGASSNANEAVAAALTNATSTGDAGNRADQFLGNSLGAGWGNLFGAGVAAVVGSSVLNFTNSSGANADTGARQAYTPSGAFRIEARILVPVTGDTVGVEVTDSLNLGTENVMGVGFSNVGPTQLYMYSRDGGVFNSRGSITLPTAVPIIYVALVRNGSNAWTGQYSYDRNTWVNILAGFSKTLTAAYMKLDRYIHGTGVIGGYDFVDVVS